MSITVAAYAPEWARRFTAERALLERVLGPWLVDVLKLRLAATHDESTAYTADKRDFVARVLAGAVITLAPRAARVPPPSTGPNPPIVH